MTETPPTSANTLNELATHLESGALTSRALIEAALTRINDPDGQGTTNFITVFAETALSEADRTDALRRAGKAPSRFAGIPISVKDLFDLEGQVSKAGSCARACLPAAKADAEVIARLKGAGFIPVGRTNMTELAFSGLGLNPHFGTPLSPWNRTQQHIAGGSSSGGAASVADGMASAAIGTDTGGSCRIPAAFCGLVGYKPTRAVIPSAGIVPLSPTLDVAGPITNSVSCARALFRIMSGTEPHQPTRSKPLSDIHLVTPENLFPDDMDRCVRDSFDAALDRLKSAGVRISHRYLKGFDWLERMSSIGVIQAIEGYRAHYKLLEQDGPQVDPRIATRLKTGADVSETDYRELLRLRGHLIRDLASELAPFDAMACPTIAIAPPRLDELTSDEAYHRINRLVLRNTSAINVMDGCSISIPMQKTSAPPTGFMLSATAGRDEHVFDIAGMLEPLITQ